MALPRPTRTRVVAFCIGALLVFLALSGIGQVGGNASGCNTGLDREPSITYPAYKSAIYGWPLKTVLVERIDCQGSPDQWGTPRTVVTWYPVGIAVSLGQVLLGGLLLYGGVSFIPAILTRTR